MVFGGLAGAAVLGFGLALAGVALLVVAIFSADDHRTDSLGALAPPVVFGSMFALSCLAATRFGWRAGRDWYFNGR